MGIGHSGSTILSILLSKHKEVISLGELIKQDKVKDKTQLCSCDKPMNECEIWGKGNYNFLKDYIVDSSRNLNRLKDLIKQNNEVKVIYLDRDIRGLSLSIDIKQKSVNINKWFPFIFVGLLKQKYMIRKSLKNNNIDYININYEDLVFNTDGTLNKIFNYIGLDSKGYNENNKVNHHIICGNRIKTDKHKKNNIVYDTSWFNNLKVNLLYLFFYPLIKVLWRNENEKNN